MDYNILRKRLRYKSCNRGLKEMDIILGNFCENHLDCLNKKQLDMFDILLNEADIDIFNWITAKAQVIEKHNNELMSILRKENIFLRIKA